MSTALVLLLTQATAGPPSAEFMASLTDDRDALDDDEAADRKATVTGSPADSYKAALRRVAVSFLDPFVEKCVSQMEEYVTADCAVECRALLAERQLALVELRQCGVQ